MTLSSTEAEYVAFSEATKTVVWLRRVLEELEIPQNPTVVYEDNSGVFKWSTGHIAQDFRRSKHVDIRYHHVREKVRDGLIELKKASTKEMVADFLTKPLCSEPINRAMKILQIERDLGEEAC